MKHPNNMMDTIVNSIAESRYDVTGDFLFKLAAKLKNDAKTDMKNGRVRLAGRLNRAALQIEASAKQIAGAWVICKKHMEEE